MVLFLIKLIVTYEFVAAAKSAMQKDAKNQSINNRDALNSSSANQTRNRYQSGTSLNKSTVNRSRMVSGAKGLAQSKLTLIKTKPIANAGNNTNIVYEIILAHFGKEFKKFCMNFVTLIVLIVVLLVHDLS